MMRTLLTLTVVVAAAVATTTAAAVSRGTAAQDVARLKQAGLPIVATVTYTAVTDPNHLLGRPNGYLSKASWVDRRVQHSNPSVRFDTANGGSIEVYSSPAAARARRTYILRVYKSMPMLGSEYVWAVGDAVLRVSGRLTPQQALRYREALDG